MGKEAFKSPYSLVTIPVIKRVHKRVSSLVEVPANRPLWGTSALAPYSPGAPAGLRVPAPAPQHSACGWRITSPPLSHPRRRARLTRLISISRRAPAWASLSPWPGLPRRPPGWKVLQGQAGCVPILPPPASGTALGASHGLLRTQPSLQAASPPPPRPLCGGPGAARCQRLRGRATVASASDG